MVSVGIGTWTLNGLIQFNLLDLDTADPDDLRPLKTVEDLTGGDRLAISVCPTHLIDTDFYGGDICCDIPFTTSK